VVALVLWLFVSSLGELREAVDEADLDFLEGLAVI